MKLLKLKTILILTAAIFLSGVFVFGFAGEIFAGTGQNVSGWAWSSNIGWIKFNNCTDINNPATCGSINYGVNLDDSGNFSGYAWSSNIGWISFNRSDTGNPPSNDSGSGAIARYDSVTGVSGWARALSQGGGWDGWIALSDMNTGDALNYGVAVNESGDFTGWAWGSDVVGWISFNCANSGTCGDSDYKITTTSSALGQPPDVPSNFSISVDNCKTEGASIPKFDWTYTHPQGLAQAEYQVRIGYNSSFSREFYCGAQRCGALGTLPNQGTMTYFLPDSLKTAWTLWASWGKTYWASIRVRDNKNRWSSWASPKRFTTPQSAFPWVNFISPPKIAVVGIEAIFDINYQSYPTSIFLIGEDGSIVERQINSCPITAGSLNWEAIGAVSVRLSSPSGDPLPTRAKIKWPLTAIGTRSVDVTFTDSDCDFCMKSTQVEVNESLSSPPPSLAPPSGSNNAPRGRYQYGE